MIQWIRICLLMQGMWVWSLVWEDSTYRGAAKPVYHNYRVRALAPMKPACPRASASQQEKPPQWEACAQQWRVAPTCPPKKAHAKQWRPSTAKITVKLHPYIEHLLCDMRFLKSMTCIYLFKPHNNSGKWRIIPLFFIWEIEEQKSLFTFLSSWS